MARGVGSKEEVLNILYDFVWRRKDDAAYIMRPPYTLIHGHDGPEHWGLIEDKPNSENYVVSIASKTDDCVVGMSLDTDLGKVLYPLTTNLNVDADKVALNEQGELRVFVANSRRRAV
jgi:hypothetical protein